MWKAVFYDSQDSTQLQFSPFTTSSHDIALRKRNSMCERVKWPFNLLCQNILCCQLKMLWLVVKANYVVVLICRSGCALMTCQAVNGTACACFSDRRQSDTVRRQTSRFSPGRPTHSGNALPRSLTRSQPVSCWGIITPTTSQQGLIHSHKHVELVLMSASELGSE